MDEDSLKEGNLESSNTASTDSQKYNEGDDEDDQIVKLARIQALNAARIAASNSSHSNKYKWSLPINIGGTSLLEGESRVEHWGHEQQRKLIQQRTVSTPSPSSKGMSSTIESKPLQSQAQVHHNTNPIEALKAGWEGILEKSQLKFEELQKDITKGVQIPIPPFLVDRGVGKGPVTEPMDHPNKQDNMSENALFLNSDFEPNTNPNIEPDTYPDHHVSQPSQDQDSSIDSSSISFTKSSPISSRNTEDDVLHLDPNQTFNIDECHRIPHTSKEYEPPPEFDTKNASNLAGSEYICREKGFIGSGK